MILKRLASKGADLQPCTRRGLTVWDAVERQPTGERRESLLRVLRAVDPLGQAKGPVVGACNGNFPEENDSASSRDPLQAAVEAADIPALRSLLVRGGRLEGPDIMAAVRSGDLDMLNFVQAECKNIAGTNTEYRKMMKATAAKIRREIGVRQSLPSLPSPAMVGATHEQGSRPSTPSGTLRLPSARRDAPWPVSLPGGGRASMLAAAPAAMEGLTSLSRPSSSGSGAGSRQRPSSGRSGGVLRQAADSMLQNRRRDDDKPRRANQELPR